MKAIRIRMKYGCLNSEDLMEVDSIYIDGYLLQGFYKKEFLHDYVKSHLESIQVNIYPYPYLIPGISYKGEKYVRSTPNSLEKDNLLKLPRE